MLRGFTFYIPESNISSTKIVEEAKRTINETGGHFTQGIRPSHGIILFTAEHEHIFGSLMNKAIQAGVPFLSVTELMRLIGYEGTFSSHDKSHSIDNGVLDTVKHRNYVRGCTIDNSSIHNIFHADDNYNNSSRILSDHLLLKIPMNNECDNFNHLIHGGRDSCCPSYTSPRQRGNFRKMNSTGDLPGELSDMSNDVSLVSLSPICDAIWEGTDVIHPDRHQKHYDYLLMDYYLWIKKIGENIISQLNLIVEFGRFMGAIPFYPEYSKEILGKIELNIAKYEAMYFEAINEGFATPLSCPSSLPSTGGNYCIGIPHNNIKLQNETIYKSNAGASDTLSISQKRDLGKSYYEHVIRFITGMRQNSSPKMSVKNIQIDVVDTIRGKRKKRSPLLTTQNIKPQRVCRGAYTASTVSSNTHPSDINKGYTDSFHENPPVNSPDTRSVSLSDKSLISLVVKCLVTCQGNIIIAKNLYHWITELEMKYKLPALEILNIFILKGRDIRAVEKSVAMHSIYFT